MSNEIGLAELIAQVKKELAVKLDDSPVFWVEKVELELNVTVKREGDTVIKIGIFSIGEASVNGKLGREDVHKIKVTLNPLLSKEDVLRNLSPEEQEKLKKDTKRTGVQGQGGPRP